jgi:hypothetical protein
MAEGKIRGAESNIFLASTHETSLGRNGRKIRNAIVCGWGKTVLCATWTERNE